MIFSSTTREYFFLHRNENSFNLSLDMVNLEINSQNESNANKFKFKYRSTFGARCSAKREFFLFILQYLDKFEIKNDAEIKLWIGR